LATRNKSAEFLPRKNALINADQCSEVSFQDRRVAVDHLASYLLSLHDSQHLSVILAGDRALPLRDLVHVMSAIRASGVRNVDIAVRGQRN
jgi:biopolymer transport protein ExbD